MTYPLLVGDKVPAAAWTSYTPALTASTTNPTLGTGSTVSGRYIVDPLTGMVDGDLRITFGTGASAGSGNYRISLPVAVNFNTGATAIGTADIIGYGLVRDNSAAGTGSRQVVAYLSQGNPGRVELAVVDGTNGTVTNAVPFTWTDGDSISLKFRYRGSF